MPLPVISFELREYMRRRLNGTDADPSSSFNSNISISAFTYGVSAFQLNELGSPPTLFLGRLDLATLIKADAVSSSWRSLAILSLAKDDLMLSTNLHSSHSLRMTPSLYSGPIYMSLDFYLQQSVRPLDGEAMFHAVEEALYSTFNTQTAAGLLPPGVTYNNELICQQGNMEWDGGSWSQHVPCALAFYRFV